MKGASFSERVGIRHSFQGSEYSCANAAKTTNFAASLDGAEQHYTWRKLHVLSASARAAYTGRQFHSIFGRGI